MAKCRDCEAKILWCEIETKNSEIKKIAVDPKPVDNGDLILKPTHFDWPMKAIRATGDDRRLGRPTYQAHRASCTAMDPEDRKKFTREDSWVREPEGY